MINKISKMLDNVADRLETKGLIKEAYEIDKIADKLDSGYRATKPFVLKNTYKLINLFDPYFKSQNEKEKTADIISVGIFVNDVGFSFEISGKNLGSYLGHPRDYFQKYQYVGRISPKGVIVNDVIKRPESLATYIHKMDLSTLYKEFYDQIKDYRGPLGGADIQEILPPGYDINNQTNKIKNIVREPSNKQKSLKDEATPSDESYWG